MLQTLTTEEETTITESTAWFRKMIAEEVTRQLTCARLVVGLPVISTTPAADTGTAITPAKRRGRPKKMKVVGKWQAVIPEAGDENLLAKGKSNDKPKHKQKLSSAGRAAIIEAQRKRWAKIRRERKKAESAAEVKSVKPAKPVKVEKPKAVKKSAKSTKTPITSPTAV